MITLSYSELTDKQKSLVCNGCGGKGGLVKPPNFLFKASCNQHDFYYWRGGTEEDRLKADKAFYEAMLVDVSNAEWYNKVQYKAIAYIYYKAVRRFGAKYFNLGKMKTIGDLAKLSGK